MKVMSATRAQALLLFKSSSPVVSELQVVRVCMAVLDSAFLSAQGPSQQCPVVEATKPSGKSAFCT
jgi:hypothetical protein